MRISLCVLLCLLAAYSTAAAQNVPKYEVFGGYSFLRPERGELLNINNYHGWEASATRNLSDSLGVTADFSGHYTGLDLLDPRVVSHPQTHRKRYRVHSFLFGPRLAYQGNSRLKPFAHALFGAARYSEDISPELLELRLGNETAFGMALGGGLDLKLNGRAAFRVGQLDYLRTQFFDSGQDNLRASIGLVINFGGK